MMLKEFVSQRLDAEQNNNSVLNKHPKISVVTPSYGQESFIERTIVSFLNQNFCDLEFIVVDDASKDGSNKIIEKYKDFSIMVGDGVNSGQTASVNIGLKMATGDVITFQNADDIFAPNAFQEVSKAFDKYPEGEVCFGNIYVIDEYDSVTNTMIMAPYPYEEQLYLGMQMHSQAMFFKTGILREKGFLNEDLNYSFYYEMMLRFTENKKHKPVYVKDLWGAFKIYSASKTMNITPAYNQERTNASQHYKSRQIKNKIFVLAKLDCYLRKNFISFENRSN